MLVRALSPTPTPRREKRENEWVSGGKEIIRVAERPVADRGRLTAVGETLVLPPSLLSPIELCRVESTKCPRQNLTRPLQSYSPFPRMVPSSPRRTINSTCAPPFFFSGLPILISPHSQTCSFTVITSKVCAARRNHRSFRTSLFWGLSNLATIGDVNTARPGLLEFTGKAKWCVFSPINPRFP